MTKNDQNVTIRMPKKSPEEADGVTREAPGKEGKFFNRGGRNLLILGIGSVIFTVITCGISLYLYRASGDIYLDRSRPGFLPEEGEEEEAPKNTFKLEEEGPITNEILKEYIDNFKSETERLDHIENPFSEAPLSDEALGIPSN